MITYCICHLHHTGNTPFCNSTKLNKFEILNHISEDAPALPLRMDADLKALVRGLLDKKEESRFAFDDVVASVWMKNVSNRKNVTILSLFTAVDSF